nr:MAG TPA: hypothetical protein [Caudoviricetes sp.]
MIRANFQHRDIKYDNKSNRPIKHARVRKNTGVILFICEKSNNRLGLSYIGLWRDMC